MAAYGMMATFYDALTDDVPYEQWVDYIEAVFRRSGVKPQLVLDLACGTGSISRILSQRGYEVIGADSSEEMLAVAAEKCSDAWNRPMFIHQNMSSLNLYGTVGAVVSCLDSINYVTDPQALLNAFKRVFLFLDPGGIFLFDINSENKLRGLDGMSFIRDGDGVFCAWSAAYSARTRCCTFIIDMFAEDSGRYDRFSEKHVERAYSTDEINRMLVECGFVKIKTYGELSARAPSPDEERIFFRAIKP